ncbi:MAG: hypothetical protein K9L88_07685 [Chromatiaceae bacterium]|nr:hypothetical protein [Chromatiaceae bacterium]
MRQENDSKSDECVVNMGVDFTMKVKRQGPAATARAGAQALTDFLYPPEYTIGGYLQHRYWPATFAAHLAMDIDPLGSLRTEDQRAIQPHLDRLANELRQRQGETAAPDEWVALFRELGISPDWMVSLPIDGERLDIEPLNEERGRKPNPAMLKAQISALARMMYGSLPQKEAIELAVTEAFPGANEDSINSKCNSLRRSITELKRRFK